MKQSRFIALLATFLLLLAACNSATEIEQFTLNLVKDGAGAGSVSISPGDINCQNTCEARFDRGTRVALSATPAADSVFAGWSGACSGVETCQVTMDSAKTVTATFDKKEVPVVPVSLTVGKDGTGSGTVTSSPAGIDCGEACGAEFDEGSAVTLTATAAEGSMFGGWDGACAGETGTTCSLTLDADKTVGATFVLMGDPVNVSVSKEGAGSGTVTSSPVGISCGSTCSADFIEDSTVTLTATPAANSLFTGWAGDCSGDSCVLTLDAAKTVTATFELKPELSVTKDGAGSGTVTSTPAGIDCGTVCTQSFNPDTEVTLSAVAGELSKFSGWGGDCGGVTEASCTLTLDASKTVTATFDELDPSELATLTVQKEGAGSGTVTSTPAGISCGATCAMVFKKGTSVSLSAAPGADSVFTGWGNCASATGDSCTLTLGADTTVTASFGKADPTSPLDVFIASSSDDAEEYLSAVNASNPAGTVDTGSSDLELTYDSDFGTNQYVGLRFTGIDLPEGSTITEAVIVFTPKADSDLSVPDLAIQAEDTLSPSTFSEEVNDITGRALTDAAVPWQPSKWTRNRVGSETTTPDLSPLLRELGWTSGDVAFVVSGAGRLGNTRSAYSFDGQGQAARAPKLVLTFSSGDPDPDPDVTFDLKLTKAGTGGGAVTSAPAGLECGADCAEATASFEKDIEVILTAAPADGSSFVAWGGACAASTETTCTLTMDAAKDVTVTFDLDTP